jgi:hypothetical protein
MSCIFAGNSANKHGGAIANFDSAIIGLDGCEFSSNRAATGSAIANDYRSRAIILNSRNLVDAEIVSDETSSVSRKRTDWPD